MTRSPTVTNVIKSLFYSNSNGIIQSHIDAMIELEQRLAALGCDKVNLLIEPENGAVQSFYRKLGFSRDELIFMEKWM